MIEEFNSQRFNTEILANDNKVANPNFNLGTNKWTNNVEIFSLLSDGGLRLTSDGNIYQKLGSDVVNNELQMAMVYIANITGTTTLKIGTSGNSDSLGSLVLSEGWNTLNFTASTINYVSIVKTSGVVDILQVNVCKTKDFIVSGKIIAGDIKTPTELIISSNWRLKPVGNVLNFEYSTDSFVTSIVANTLIAE